MDVSITPPKFSDEVKYYDYNTEMPKPKVFNPPRDMAYTEVSTKGISIDILKHVIGKDGRTFKAITYESDVEYIFLLPPPYEAIGIWGFPQTLADGKRRVEERLAFVLEKARRGDYDNNREKKLIDTPYLDALKSNISS